MTDNTLRIIGIRLRKTAAQVEVVFGVLLLLSVRAAAQTAATHSPAEWVNPFIGTSATSGPGHYGGMMPLVSWPFGTTNWTPQTRQNMLSVVSYAYEDNQISGFIGTHQPAIWMGDYGYVTLMPELNGVVVAQEGRKLPFSHADEVATPYYYSVILRAPHGRTIKAEMTATTHCAILRFTYPKSSKSNVLVEVTRPRIRGFVQVSPGGREVSGYNPDRMDSNLGPFSLPNFKGYFVAQFSKPFTNFGAFQGPGGPSQDGRKVAEGENVGAYVSFKTDEGESVEVRVGVSFISMDQARDNLKREIPSWSFEVVRNALKDEWNRRLGILTIEGADDAQRAIFYTGLYHAMLYPRLFSEYGRYYSAFDDSIHDGVSYTDYSLWDTFRAENSLLTLVAPDQINGMVTALLQNYKEGGWMPKWPNPSYTNIMIGTHADSVVAEAINKGFRGFDYNLAYEAVHKDAMSPPEGDEIRQWIDREPGTPYEARAGLTFYKKLGYVPADTTAESASRTLEDAYDDWCVGQVAKAVGKVEDFVFFTARSRNYRLLFHRETGFMQARNRDGSWADPDTGWTEGDKWTYSWAVLHDIPGLMALMGGPEAFNSKLDRYFDEGHNFHANEPSHHYGYLYDFSGEPWKTQSKVREIAAQNYTNHPDGLTGNDDCGQMSAWYVFSALGFYPVNPASGEYMIGSPFYPKATLKLPSGARFVVSAINNSKVNKFIRSAKLNGVPLSVPYIHYKDIERGGRLEFVMSSSPSKWASDWKPSPLPSQ